MPLAPNPYRAGTEAHYRDGAYYDRRYRRRQTDVTYYVELATRFGGPVLELGVGTARVAMKIAANGIDVVGVDAMLPMLDQARHRLRKGPAQVRARVTLVQADLQAIQLGRRFPLIIAPFNVFMHLYTRQEMERALAAIRLHLEDGGCFAFDVSNPDPRALARDPTRVYKCRPLTDPKTRAKIRYSEAFHYDGPSQIMHMSLIHEPSDIPEEMDITALSQRQYFPAELEALLHYNGLQISRQFGDFHGTPLTGQSESIVLETTARMDLATP